MTVPRSLALVEKEGTYSVISQPVSELEKLRIKEFPVTSEVFELGSKTIELLLPLQDEQDFSLRFYNDSGEEVVLSRIRDLFIFDRSKSGVTSFEDGFGNPQTIQLNSVQLESVKVFVDQSSIEVFLNDGAVAITNLVFPKRAYSHVELRGIPAQGRYYHLASIWKQ